MYQTNLLVVVIEKLSQRKGELQTMGAGNGGYTRLEFRIPSRGLIGYRGDFMTDTKGNGIMNTAFDGYAPYKGDIQYRKQGSLIAFETGESVTYGLSYCPGAWTVYSLEQVKKFTPVWSSDRMQRQMISRLMSARQNILQTLVLPVQMRLSA